MEAKKKALLTFGIAVIVIVVLYFIASSITKYTGYSIQENADDFAKCLASKSTLYVKEGCPACANQEAMFGDSVQYLTIIDCAKEPQKCVARGVGSVPAWDIDNKLYYGPQDFSMLEELTGCKVNT